MSSTPFVIFGTSNRNKAIEATRVVASSRVVLRPLSEFPNAIDVVEAGVTFAENAQKKAVEQALGLKQWVLAEDSGICVDYLDGKPGVYSARFAGEEPRDDKKNNAKLLELMREAPIEKRNAHYTCHMTLVDPNGKIVFDVEEICRGRILTQEFGSSGFGYDPLFEVVEFHRSFGELSPVVKSVISHRARATRKLIPVLCELAAKNLLPTFEPQVK